MSSSFSSFHSEVEQGNHHLTPCGLVCILCMGNKGVKVLCNGDNLLVFFQLQFFNLLLMFPYAYLGQDFSVLVSLPQISVTQGVPELRPLKELLPNPCPQNMEEKDKGECYIFVPFGQHGVFVVFGPFLGLASSPLQLG